MKAAVETSRQQGGVFNPSFHRLETLHKLGLQLDATGTLWLFKNIIINNIYKKYEY